MLGKHSRWLCVCISGYYISISSITQSTFLFFLTHCTGMPHLIKINSLLDTHRGNKGFSSESYFFQGLLGWPNHIRTSARWEKPSFIIEMPTIPDLLLNIRSVLGSHIPSQHLVACIHGCFLPLGRFRDIAELLRLCSRCLYEKLFTMCCILYITVLFQNTCVF